MKKLFSYSALIVIFVISSFFDAISADEPRVSKDSIEFLTKASQAMAEIVAAVRPAVVNISTTRTIKTPGIPHPFFDDPLFRKFFGDEFELRRKREHRVANLGSGVIVDKNGYILTNNHVIKGADDIRIRLSDRREFKGKIIGTDPKTDLAVIKIDAERLPTIKWGDSDKLRVGETVIAIGNPFGLHQTVTSGIISAMGRANVGIADYEDFIQTDAAINPGNSGGALVNTKGELIGINTAIFSTSGGFQGIGFAIPSNMAKTVMEHLVKRGKVIRGWLGVTVQNLTPELVQHFKLKNDRGVLVTDVTEQSPAHKAGLMKGDILLEFDGKEVNDPTILRNMVANSLPGKEVPIKLLRGDSIRTLKVTISELPSEKLLVAQERNDFFRGVTIQNITPEMRKSMQLPKTLNGVIVIDIDVSSPAKGFLQKNDIITEINRKKIKNMNQFREIIATFKDLKQMSLIVYRNGAYHSLYVPFN
ncbi:MAG: DegQ family serine endoprotease [Thermodesulfovibrionales bacterium]|nr:DegQ family serine endoprotease [Thermodesulfovibrionales bacterium]